ncbi:large ribosomal subunit protein mL48-like [Amphiura filiformis]|uniref:large ribosomal subunit protein mL48-like n=1 Tax=Amphiura filiformis TaxID=82378 RepID=UPI003B210513
MFQRTIARSYVPLQTRFIYFKSSCSRHKQLCCIKSQQVPHVGQPIRNYAINLDDEIAKLKIQQIPDQDIPDAKDEQSYEMLNIRVYGHDCNSVEHFAQYIHRLAMRLNINAPDSYAVQTKETLVSTLSVPGEVRNKPKDFMLKTHERTVQLQDLSTLSAPIFLEMIQTNMPEGVTLRIEPHTQDHYKERFVRKEIPDNFWK